MTIVELINLTFLDCSNASGIDQKGISGIKNLLILKVHRNPKIISVNPFLNLTELSCAEHCGIDQKCISELINLKILHAGNNEK